MRPSLAHRLLVLLVAIAMQLCCCRVHAILATGACGTAEDARGSEVESSPHHCCCHEQDSSDPSPGPDTQPAPEGCLCGLTLIKAQTIQHDVEIPALSLVAVLPYETAEILASAPGPETTPTPWPHAPPDRPAGRATLDRSNRRLI
ncbi:MAG: hypothetical protein O2819_08825 [Planctomycetota bacterium]|nr:hypothetical protein [Planctomycetota bacterium]MDA1106261.1 hypothetical protein [Planctomycetota bacterium]